MAQNLKTYLAKNGAWVGFVSLLIMATILTDGSFLSARNLTNLMRQTSINAILAGGMTLIILTSGIDLSIGSLVALAGVIVGISQVTWGWSELGLVGAIGSALLALLCGTSAGALSGTLIAKLKIPPFVITLGMMVVARGVALLISNGTGISPMGDTLRMVGEEYLSPFTTTILILGLGCALVWFNRRQWKSMILPLLALILFGKAFIFYKGLPVPVVIMIVCLLGLSFLLKLSSFGRSVFAIGSNEQAAFWAGVPLIRTKIGTYTLMGGLAGLAGVILSARLNAAVPTAGNLFELDAIASVVIGGTSLKGGVGGVMGSLVGALTIATLDNSMDLLQVPSFYQMIIKGLMIILAVAADKVQQPSSN